MFNNLCLYLKIIIYIVYIMLLTISYKNWPNIIYIKYNDEYTKNIKNNDESNEEFINVKKQIYKMIEDIIEFKKNNSNTKIYVIINIDSVKKIDLTKISFTNSLYDEVIKNIKKYISKIYIIHNNITIINLIKIFISLKYIFLIKLFKYFRTIEQTQNYINKNNKNNNKNNKNNNKNNIIKKISSNNIVSSSQL